jgi:imidazolonepropionase-like amidohydrolase
MLPGCKKKGAVLLALSALLCAPGAFAAGAGDGAILFHAARVFDGDEIRNGVSVLVDDGKVVRVDERAAFAGVEAARVIDLGNATLLPGFIELHAHLAFQNVPHEVVLRHGVTTVRDLGGPLHPPRGGDGRLRVLTSGPIITVPGGYPINVFGPNDIARAVSTEEEARAAVRDLVEGGAAVIKIALEPGGEAGAPWAGGHGHHGADDTHASPAPAVHASAHGHGHATGRTHEHGTSHVPAAAVEHPESAPTDADRSAHGHVHGQARGNAHDGIAAPAHGDAWPMLTTALVRAIVDEAHRHHRKVSAHIGDERGALIALQGGVDEWAHIPCARLPDGLLVGALRHKVTVVTTIDTLSRCDGIAANARGLGALGVELLYGAEIAHPDVPWGIDAQELMYMKQWAGMKTIDTLRSATARAGAHLGVPLLGTLRPGAPADLIAVRGNPLHALKTLEYPELVVSGGVVVVNGFD